MIGDKIMATAIKAIPTLHGKEAKEFLRHAEEAERNFKGFKNIEEHPFCVMASSILGKAGYGVRKEAFMFSRVHNAFLVN